MTGRESVFSNPTIVQLASERFIPVAENSSALERQAGNKGEFFRHVVEHGHYAGRTHPTGTRQGSYTFTADGRFLGSINSRDPEEMAEMMRAALVRHEQPDALGEAAAAQLAYEKADADDFPVDGLVLQAVVRDLPRADDKAPADHRWNLDYVWIRRDEARALAPESLEVGQRREAPWSVMRRLARFHLRDYVRGEPFNWPEEAIERAELTSEIVDVSGSLVRLMFEGSARITREMKWLEPESGETRRSDTGFDCALRGEATWDDTRGGFIAFDLAAAGQRWGTNQYNFRGDDLGPAPMGIAFSLAGSTPGYLTPPHCLHTWRLAEEEGTLAASRASVGGDRYFG